jgi:hypothetical protein
MTSRDVKETSESQMVSPSTIEGNIELWEYQAYVLLVWLRVGTHVVGSVLDFTSDAYRGCSRHTGRGMLFGKGSRFQSHRRLFVSYAATKQLSSGY